MKKHYLLTFIMLQLTLNACASGRNAMSERSIASSPAGSPTTQVAIREVPDNKPKQEFYLKNSELVIKPNRKPASTGSLASINDPRSYILPTNLPVEIGSVLEVKTSSNRLDAPPESADKSKGKTDDKASAKVEEELMKALPNLEPGGDAANKPTIVKSFKAKVIEVRENGDAVVVYHRQSIRADLASDFLIKAVVPFDALNDRENIKTTHLQDVQMRESFEGEITERSSQNWEDEYTLRLSGFDEAKSRSALVLDAQKKQLQEARNLVVSQIKSLGNERNTMAKERAELLDKKVKDEEKIAAQEAKIKEQESQIEKLTPKEEQAVADSAETDPAKADAAKADAAKKPAPKASDKDKQAQNKAAPAAAAKPKTVAKSPANASGGAKQ